MACVTRRRNRWVIDFYDHQGRRKWITLPKGIAKKKAKEKLREIEDQLSKGTWIPEKKIPTFKKVADDWLDYKKPNVRHSTWRKYKGYVDNRFCDFNDFKINRITIATVEKFISARQSENINLKTLRKVLVVYNQIMNYAVRHRYIDFNPVREAEKPKNNGKARELKVRILASLEINSFLRAEGNPKYQTLFKLAIMSGARQGELLGLKWTDVDWFNCQIHIQRTFNEGKWFKPKSNASIRKIDLGCDQRFRSPPKASF
jgi:integrase